MTSERPSRPWWRKKRWIAAGLLWLAVGYPLAVGPVQHAALRGVLPMEVMSLGTPATLLALQTPLATPYGWYLAWWWSLGELPDYEVSVTGKGITFVPTDRYYHRHPAPQIRWRLRDGF